MFDEMDEEAFEYLGNEYEEMTDPLYKSKSRDPNSDYGCGIVVTLAIGVAVILTAAVLIIALFH